MIQRRHPGFKTSLEIGIPIKTGIFKAGAQHAFPALFHHAHILGVKVQHGEKMRHEPPFPIFHAKTFLVRFHTGEQHFARQFQKDGVKISEQRNGVFHQPFNFTQQGIVPEHAASNSRSPGVAAGDDSFPPCHAGCDDPALFSQYGVHVVRMRHFKRAGAMHPVAACHSARFHIPHSEGHNLPVKQGNNPVHGAGIGKASAPPAHALGKGKRADNGRHDIFQHILSGSAANCFTRGNVGAFFRLLREQSGKLHTLPACESHCGLGRLAFGVIRGLE